MPVEFRQVVRQLRQNQTPAEKRVWELVRNRKIDGYRFIRQHAIPFTLEGISRFFVADFYCSKKQLVIEIDGDSHIEKKDYDQIRTHILEQKGLKVVRFTNLEILQDRSTFIERLKEILRT